MADDSDDSDSPLTPEQIEALMGAVNAPLDDDADAEVERVMQAVVEWGEECPRPQRRHRILTEEERGCLGGGILEVWQINDLLSAARRGFPVNPDGERFRARLRRPRRRAWRRRTSAAAETR